MLPKKELPKYLKRGAKGIYKYNKAIEKAVIVLSSLKALTLAPLRAIALALLAAVLLPRIRI